MVSKSELIAEIAQEMGTTKKQTKEFIETFWNKIQEHVSVGSDVQFIGIGKFYKKHTDAREGHNPQNGEKVNIPAYDKLAFKSNLKF